MVHPLTHKEVAAYVLNTSVKRLPADLKFSDKQYDQLNSIEKEVDLCVKDIYKTLISEPTFTLKTFNYLNLFSKLLPANGAIEFVISELSEEGIELEESSSKLHLGFGMAQSNYFELKRKQVESNLEG